jgi:phage terminase large subunit-like protein
MLNYLAGPSAQARPNSELFSTAQSRDQAAILFSIASKMVRLDPTLRAHESAKALSCPELGTKYRDAARVFDLRGYDPKVVCHVYSAPFDLEPFSELAIQAANPGFDHFQNRDELFAMAASAKRMPSLAAKFRNLNLNQRVAAATPFISPEAWSACGGEPIDFAGKPVYVAIDLSESADLTAMVVAHLDPAGVWHIRAHFYLPAEGLQEKAHIDHAPYEAWVEAGLVEATPGKTIGYEPVRLRAETPRKLPYAHSISIDLMPVAGEIPGADRHSLEPALSRNARLPAEEQRLP